MAEIGLGKGAGAGSFASGFGRGLSQALLQNRQRGDEKAQEERARKDRLFQTMLPVMLQNMEDPADLQPLLESQFPDVFTQAKKGGKKGESPWDKLAGFLGPMVGIHKKPGTIIEAGWPGGPVTMGPGGVGMDSPESGGLSGMLGRSPGPFGTKPTSVGASPLGGALPPSTQPTGVSGGTLGNRPVYQSETTPLSPAEEQQFQAWAQANKITDVDHPDSHYDYRGYWKETGGTPIRFGIDHFPDTYKQHGHPTFSQESKYSRGPNDGGTWQGEKFIPAQTGGLAQGLLRDVPPDISQTPMGGTTPPVPPDQTHRYPSTMSFGVRVLTPEGRAQRDADAETAKMKREVEARRSIAAQLYPDDPAKSVDYALYGTRPPATSVSGGSISSARLFQDQLDRKAKDLGRPLTSQEVANERKEWESLNDRPSNLGIYAEAAARELGFDSADAAAQNGQMAAVVKRADEMAANRAGTTTAARVGELGKAPLTTKQKFDLQMGLTDDWRKAEAPQREMERQFGLMQTGLKRFNEGDKNGGSQAVLVTFQKILDPTSVVRESEYARSAAGLGLIDRIEGMYERAKAGGAGVPAEDLAAIVETARQFLEGQKDYNSLERDRITGTAKDAGLNPDRIFGVAGAAQRQGAQTGPVTLDTPIYIDPVTKKPTLTKPR